MPGISAVKTTIPFSRKGFSASAYWATLISATVENAASTDVVLTFPAPAALGATDFTIAGFTISSASWTGAVLTLVVTPQVTVFNGNPTITFVKTGGTAIVTNNVLDDGNTVGWYDSQALSTITKDVNEHVTAWKNKLGVATSDLTTVGGTPHWSTSGVLFDGVDDKLQNTFALNQPCIYYVVLKQKSFTNGDYILGGINASSFIISQDILEGDIKCESSVRLVVNGQTIIDKLTIVRVKLNGANSKIQVNDNVAVTGNAGTVNPGGILLGSARYNANYGNVEFAEIIARAVDEATGMEDGIFNYVKNKYPEVFF